MTKEQKEELLMLIDLYATYTAECCSDWAEQHNYDARKLSYNNIQEFLNSIGEHCDSI